MNSDFVNYTYFYKEFIFLKGLYFLLNEVKFFFYLNCQYGLKVILPSFFFIQILIN